MSGVDKAAIDSAVKASVLEHVQLFDGSVKAWQEGIQIRVQKVEFGVGNTKDVLRQLIDASPDDREKLELELELLRARVDRDQALTAIQRRKLELMPMPPLWDEEGPDGAPCEPTTDIVFSAADHTRSMGLGVVTVPVDACSKADKLQRNLAALDSSFKSVVRERNRMARAIESMQTRARAIIKLIKVVDPINILEVHSHAQGIVHRWTEDAPGQYGQRERDLETALRDVAGVAANALACTGSKREALKDIIGKCGAAMGPPA